MRRQGSSASSAGAGPAKDFTTAPPVPLAQMLVLVNEYVSTTVEFLNDAAEASEERLFEANARLDRMEVALDLLERALPAASQASPHSSPVVAREVDSTATAPTSHPRPAPPAPRSDGAPPPQKPPSDKYTKMLGVGIPRQAVLNQMVRDGADPASLP